MLVCYAGSMASFNKDDFVTTDYQLLLNGPVALFQDTSILEDYIAELKAMKYAVHDVDTKDRSMQEWLRMLGESLNFPDYFKGDSLDSFNDLMHDVRFGEYGYGWDSEADTGIVLVLRHYDAFSAANSDEAHSVADIIADNSRVAMLAGNRMILLLQVDDADYALTAIGATAANWNDRESLASSRKR